jgi:hypothetical protein
MEKEALYYVLKYGDKYYAPFANMSAFNGVDQSIDAILSIDRNLAVRFSDRVFALSMQQMERDSRSMIDGSFDPEKCRVVKVVRKERIIN